MNGAKDALLKIRFSKKDSLDFGNKELKGLRLKIN